MSILLPVLNEGKHLRQCVESLQSQTYPWKEIIVLFDSSSSDDSISILNSFGQTISLVKLPHSRISVALNQGLRLAKGGIIFYAEGDCVYKPECIERAVKLMAEENAGASAVLPRFFGVNSFWGSVQDDFQAIRNQWFLEGRNPVNWAYFYRKEVLEMAGGFPESLLQGEDQFLAVKVKRLGYSISLPDEILRLHAVSGKLNSFWAAMASSFRTAYLHAVQGFSPQNVLPKIFLAGFLIAAFIASVVFFSAAPFAASFALAYLVFASRIFPYRRLVRPSSLAAIPVLALSKSFFFALGFVWGLALKPFVSLAAESRGM